MPRLTNKLPSYRLHRRSGQAVVTLGGKDFYLGAHASPESRREYQRLVAEWLVNHKQPMPTANDQVKTSCVAALIVAYVKFAEGYYVKNGEATSMIHRIRSALRILLDRYGKESVTDFGPLKFKAIRQAMVEQGLCISTIKDYTSIITRMFAWGAENELVSASVHYALKTVAGLRAGRCEAKGSTPVKPVTEAMVEAVLPHVNSRVAAMIRLQLLSGMRPGEVVVMRSCDLDTTGKIWIYKPASHKTEHHGRERLIYLGPQAQEVLKPWLKSDLNAFLFSPRDAMEEEWRLRRANRQSPMTPSQAKRTRRRNPGRTPGDRYTTDSYERAISRACQQAFSPPTHLRPAVLADGTLQSNSAFRRDLDKARRSELNAWQKTNRWSPNQLRHNAGTLLRKEFGIDAARVILGHSSPKTTEVYAELD